MEWPATKPHAAGTMVDVGDKTTNLTDLFCEARFCCLGVRFLKIPPKQPKQPNNDPFTDYNLLVFPAHG